MSTSTKTALVTGGSRGLGRDMALSIAKKGIDVVITYNSRKEDAEEVVHEIEKLGQKAAALQLNTGNSSSFTAFAAQLSDTLKNTFGTERIDFLVNNAGIAGYTLIAETEEAQFDELVNVHFKGVYFLTQKLLSLINDGGRIINISTGLTRMTFPGSGVYAAVKSAVETITRYMALEFGKRGIAVNAVAPGAVATDFGGGRLRNSPEMQEHVKDATALGRIAHPEDIGGVVAFLCTPEAGWINAQRIEVSGGMRL
ncbi:SDR family oxidoreductase [Chitinophagaceae bacterium MMS25-I14]